MTVVSVVIPTIDGREISLLRCLDAYHRTTPAGTELQIITILNRPTCGQAWNEGAALATGEYLHISADDLEPRPGWLEAAIECVERGLLPAPWVLLSDGTMESCGVMSPESRTPYPAGHLPEQSDWTGCEVGVIPFMPRAVWLQIGPVAPIHYWSDHDLSRRAREAGYGFAVRRGYCFIHHREPAGRARQEIRYRQDRRLFLAGVA